VKELRRYWPETKSSCPTVDRRCVWCCLSAVVCPGFQDYSADYIILCKIDVCLRISVEILNTILHKRCLFQGYSRPSEYRTSESRCLLFENDSRNSELNVVLRKIGARIVFREFSGSVTFVPRTEPFTLLHEKSCWWPNPYSCWR
jgi:hypothetical protein